MKKFVLILVAAVAVGCGSSDQTCFPVAGGTYCVNDVNCTVADDGAVSCTGDNGFGTLFAAVKDNGKLQLCVSDKDTKLTKCFDPESECTIDGSGQINCQKANWMEDDPCFGKACTGACATCGRYTWCATEKDFPDKAGTCVNACDLWYVVKNKNTDDDCASFSSCPSCVCFIANRQWAYYNDQTNQYSECVSFPTIDCTDPAKVGIIRDGIASSGGVISGTRFDAKSSCTY